MNDYLNPEVALIIKSKKTYPKFSSFYKSVLIAIMTFFTLIIGATTLSQAAIDVYDFDSKRQEAQYRGLIDEFRCPKCQNQNLAGSDAPIAQDLKQKTYDMVKDGRSDAEIRQYMQERYGDFISYNPPVRPSTWILWFFPPLLLLLILGGWFWRSSAKNRSSSTANQHATTSGINKDSSLNAEEQLALDRLLASRTVSEQTITDEATADKTAVKPKLNQQKPDKGESL